MSWIDAYREQYEMDKAQPDHPSEPAPGEPRPYSVLLVYPDYLSDGSHESFYTAVQAPNVKEAVRLAQGECMRANWDEEEDESVIHDPDDLMVLLVIAGDHADLRYQMEEEETDAAL